MDAKLKISLSCRTLSVRIQKHGLPDLQFLPKIGVTGLDHLETVLPTYWSTSFAVPLIPESDMAEEDQDMKMHEEKELCRG